jgi:high-affinity K+ transport system ATPase subunit B
VLAASKTSAKSTKKASIIGAMIITSILIGTLIYLSLQSSAGEEFDIVNTIVSNLYVVANGVLLVPAIYLLLVYYRNLLLLYNRIQRL